MDLEKTIKPNILKTIEQLKDDPNIFKILLEEAKKRGLCIEKLQRPVKKVSKIKYIPYKENEEKTYEQRFDQYYKELKEKSLKDNNPDDKVLTITPDNKSELVSNSLQNSNKEVKRLRPIKIKKRLKKRLYSISQHREGGGKSITSYNFSTPNKNYDIKIQLDNSFPMISQNKSSILQTEENWRMGSQSRQNQQRKCELHHPNECS